MCQIYDGERLAINFAQNIIQKFIYNIFLSMSLYDFISRVVGPSSRMEATWVSCCIFVFFYIRFFGCFQRERCEAAMAGIFVPFACFDRPARTCWVLRSSNGVRDFNPDAMDYERIFHN